MQIYKMHALSNDNNTLIIIIISVNHLLHEPFNTMIQHYITWHVIIIHCSIMYLNCTMLLQFVTCKTWHAHARAHMCTFEHTGVVFP